MGVCSPFLKWAGGKRWLVSHLPTNIPTQYKRYIEPFLGSGAVFFAVNPQESILCDLNVELIATYKAIRQDWETVYGLLSDHQTRHCESHYYKVRSNIPHDKFEAAARFLYLNRSCWNGLYRVNRKGQFNVPIGTKTNILLPTDDFALISHCLKHSKLHACDFEWAVDQAGKGDFIYTDPPYTINHENNGFVKYNQNLFSWDDQVRLRDALVRAINRGASVLVSNACHGSIAKLYRGDFFRLKSLPRFSRISGNNLGRRFGREYLIIGVKQ